MGVDEPNKAENLKITSRVYVHVFFLVCGSDEETNKNCLVRVYDIRQVAPPTEKPPATRPPAVPHNVIRRFYKACPLDAEIKKC